MIYTRTALMLDYNKLIMMDCHNQGYRTDTVNTIFAEGAALSATITLVFITGLNTNEEIQGITISKQLQEMSLPDSAKKHQFHSSLI